MVFNVNIKVQYLNYCFQTVTVGGSSVTSLSYCLNSFPALTDPQHIPIVN